MKKLTTLLAKGFILFAVCLLLTNIIQLPSLDDGYTYNPGYSTFSAPEPKPEPDEDPFGEPIDYI